MVKRLANKTTLNYGPSRKENKQVKAYDWPKRWWQWDENNQGSSNKI